MTNSLQFWENYYKSNQRPTTESFFAQFVLPFLEEKKSLYEIGCGNGRDSIFFAKHNVDVTGFDQCENEVEFLNSEFKDINNLNFQQGDFTALGKRPSSDYIYSRFSLHSVNLEKEIQTLNWAKDTLKDKGLFFIEIRSVKDELYGDGEEVEKNAFVTDHYRRFVELDSFCNRLEKAGLSVIYRLQSAGLAPYKEFDPEVIRVIAQK